MAEEDKTVRMVSAEDFAALDYTKVTLVDVREPDELLISQIDGALNIPFSTFPNGLDEIPKGKPVYVYCRSGDWSFQVAEILADRGYDVYNLVGGYKEYLDYRNHREPIFVDAKGLKCPGPIVKVADQLRGLQNGDRIRVEATEDAFASDIAVWCERTGNKLLKLDVGAELITAEIEKRENSADRGQKAADAVAVEREHGKNFVVFSGDLDKTIAAFIMANGAAAMGREVTMFFTFWGLNILRKPKKVRVTKTFIEKMFGIMMPRGTKKLGLSRMNMGGAGAKMIRGIMKQKGIESLEDLIQDAIDHGVKIVACQMSMDIMGIHKEELIDGVSLGGVSTFLGAGEQSDMSLFI